MSLHWRPLVPWMPKRAFFVQNPGDCSKYTKSFVPGGLWSGLNGFNWKWYLLKWWKIRKLKKISLNLQWSSWYSNMFEMKSSESFRKLFKYSREKLKQNMNICRREKKQLTNFTCCFFVDDDLVELNWMKYYLGLMQCYSIEDYLCWCVEWHFRWFHAHYYWP